MYEIEKILSHKIDEKKNKVLFEVKWKGGSSQDNTTWEYFLGFTRDAPILV